CMECLLFMSKSPFLVPTQPKSIGTEHLLDSGLGGTGARYWYWVGRVLGQRLENVTRGYFSAVLSNASARIWTAVHRMPRLHAVLTDQDGKPARNSPACAARLAVGDAVCADEDRARHHPASYLGCGARRIGGRGALDRCALHGLQGSDAAG